MAKYELSISPDYAPDWTIVDAVRELFQNALDQQTTDPSNEMFFHYDGVNTLQVANKKSVLSAQSLLLGSTTKRGDDNTIGQFGEGYKLATLILVRNDKKVTFFNYGKREIWTPRFVKARRYGGQKILTFFTDREFVWKVLPHSNLIVAIDGITPDEYNEIVESNLHLQSEYDKIETSMGDILLDERHAGKLFVRGLFVRDMDDMKYGYDIKPKYLKLDRDRKLVRDFDIQWITSQMWKESKSDKVVDLVKDKCEDTAFLSSHISTYTNVDISITNKAHNTFREEHGDNAIPVTGQSELDEVTTRYVDAKPVLVSDSYKKLIEKDPDYSIKATEKKEKKLSLFERLELWGERVRDEYSLSDEDYNEFLDLIGEVE